MTSLIIPAACLGLVALIIGAAWFIGRQGGTSQQETTDLEKDTDVQTAMLDASATTPRDAGSVDERLRDGSF